MAETERRSWTYEDMLREGVDPKLYEVVDAIRAEADKHDLVLVEGAGGLLVQNRDLGSVDEAALKVVTKRAPDADEIADLLFAWKVVKFVKSNAIVYAKGGATVGIGAGQMSRVDASRIAVMKAADNGFDLTGAAQLAEIVLGFGRMLANVERVPTWNPDAEFRPLRKPVSQ